MDVIIACVECSTQFIALLKYCKLCTARPSACINWHGLLYDTDVDRHDSLLVSTGPLILHLICHFCENCVIFKSSKAYVCRSVLSDLGQFLASEATFLCSCL